MHHWRANVGLLIAGVCLILATAARAGAVAEYVCRAVSSPPVMDGRLEDPCWQQAEKSPVFLEFGVGGKPVQNMPRLLLVRDRDALYVGVDATTAPGQKPFGRDRGRDGKKEWEIGTQPLFVMSGKMGAEKLMIIGQHGVSD